MCVYGRKCKNKVIINVHVWWGMGDHPKCQIQDQLDKVKLDFIPWLQNGCEVIFAWLQHVSISTTLFGICTNILLQTNNSILYISVLPNIKHTVMACPFSKWDSIVPMTT